MKDIEVCDDKVTFSHDDIIICVAFKDRNVIQVERGKLMPASEVQRLAIELRIVANHMKYGELYKLVGFPPFDGWTKGLAYVYATAWETSVRLVTRVQPWP